MWTGSLSPASLHIQIMFHRVLQKPISRRSVGQLMIKAAVFFSKKTSHSVRQSSLIMSGPDDRASMEAAVNGKYSVRVRRQHISRGSPVAVLKMWGREKLMRLFSHPQHNLLRWEGGCEARAEGKSVMTLFHPVAQSSQGVHLHLPPLHMAESSEGGQGVQGALTCTSLSLVSDAARPG